MQGSLSEANISVTNLGFFRDDDDQPGVPDQYKNPLNVKLFIRGTAGDQIAIQLRGRASVAYSTAVEKGSEGEGRSGELVLWERSTTGSGPAAQLQPAIVEAMISRSKTFLKNLKTNWQK